MAIQLNNSYSDGYPSEEEAIICTEIPGRVNINTQQPLAWRNVSQLFWGTDLLEAPPMDFLFSYFSLLPERLLSLAIDEVRFITLFGSSNFVK